MSDQRILRYQVVLMENPGLTIFPSDPSAYHQGLSPLSLLPRNLGPLDKTSGRIVRRSSDWSWGNGRSFVLDGKRRARYAVVSNFWDHRCFDTSYVSSIAWAHSPNSSFRAGERKKSSHLHRLQLCLSRATCTCCHLERKGPLDHQRVPNQIWW